MEVIFTDRFLGRVEKYTDYIALDNIPAAIKWARGVFDECERLRENPQIGRMITEYEQPELRELIYGNYRLIYELRANRIDMLTIWHIRQPLPDEPQQI